MKKFTAHSTAEFAARSAPLTLITSSSGFLAPNYAFESRFNGRAGRSLHETFPDLKTSRGASRD